MDWETVTLILGIVWAIVGVIGIAAWSSSFDRDGLGE